MTIGNDNMKIKRILIMGAAGRDFHNFNLCYRNNPDCEVVAFTATQIPFIERRTYPASLAGHFYPKGIPIYPESDLGTLIKSARIDEVIFSYSDVSHDYVMERASLCAALGADFVLLGAEKTMLKSAKPVISVCAVRTGCGKSGVTLLIAKQLTSAGHKVVVIRHPMPYGNIESAKVQRFQSVDDLQTDKCTIEEMEEYEHLIECGIIVFAGVDYLEVLKAAEKEAEIIIWDGGNNDLPFIRPDLEICVADAIRAGHEISYYPGEANLLRADVVIINKVNSSTEENAAQIEHNVRKFNNKARIIKTASVVTVEGLVALGKNALVIEDGPTLTHGGMTFGAGTIAAGMLKAEPVDPSPYAIGTIKATLDKYPHIKNLLPAVGYTNGQIRELELSINNTPCDVVLIATPVNLARFMKINKPAIRVSYQVKDIEEAGLAAIIDEFMKRPE